MKVTGCSLFAMPAQYCLYNVTGSLDNTRIVFLIKQIPATISHDVTDKYTPFQSARASENVTYCICRVMEITEPQDL